jgi:hypothetical protein
MRRQLTGLWLRRSAAFLQGCETPVELTAFALYPAKSKVEERKSLLQ